MNHVSKVLVVDDDPNLRKTLADILRVKGYVSVVAGSGAEAIAMATQELIPLALVDLKLPDMSGLDVMERIKAVSPLTEVIILTGNASLDTAIEATRRGAFSYLLKPYQMDDLLLNIRHGVDRQQAQTQIRRLSEALRQSHEPVILIDAELNFDYVNQAFTRLFGYGMEEVLGQSISLLGVPGDDAGDPLRIAAIAASMEGFTGEVSRRGKDGRVIPVLLSMAPIRDEQGRISNYVTTMTDLTTIRRMEESLRENEEKFRSISASAHDGIVMLDENAAITFWNGAAENIFGYSVEEALGQDVHELVTPERFRPAAREGFAGFKTTGQGAAIGGSREVMARRKGGAEFPLEMSISAVRHKDKWLSIGIARDISARKQAEAEEKARLEQLSRTNHELKILNTKLEQAQNQLLQSEKMASIGMLAAGVAHEINNPIGFIKSNMQSLERYTEDLMRVVSAYERAEVSLPERSDIFEELHEVKDQIEFDYVKQDIRALIAESLQGLERVTKIVVDLKNFSHMESKDQWTMDDIHSGIESTLNVIWNELKYTCEVKKEYGQLPLVECVISQLNQVFMNLLVNAAQAIEGKGIITIRTGTEGEMIWVEIADTGKGIAAENLGNIFDPFYTTKPVGKGTGLGLSVSYGIIQKHHGRITVESETSQGTKFRVWLPILQPSLEGENRGGQ
ncbi:PAS domain S-box protein [Denitratisoma oestradiolicum]|uniref:histidine kinase n=1 Tax=Denitratisoma oestradiolicum TaxID=311182 RepID=A0A6S6XWS8_9PROT|nr:PAS domain S-box protein [Denitratisoma oestradiolicum]CAB1369329.1 putative Histidine kinase [Denitratisoma oestradiolicum]